MVIGMERFSQYLFRCIFELITDNKAFGTILRNPLSKPPARIKRMFLGIIEFTFKVTHKSGANGLIENFNKGIVKIRKTTLNSGITLEAALNSYL